MNLQNGSCGFQKGRKNTGVALKSHCKGIRPNWLVGELIKFLRKRLLLKQPGEQTRCRLCDQATQSAKPSSCQACKPMSHIENTGLLNTGEGSCSLAVLQC